MKKILIATKNPHKQKKLAEIVSNYFMPEIRKDLKEVEEYGDNFLEIAENKAKDYSKKNIIAWPYQPTAEQLSRPCPNGSRPKPKDLSGQTMKGLKNCSK